MVLPIRLGGILPVPIQEGSTECVPIRLLILVLLTGRRMDDSPSHYPNFSILVAWQGYLPLYGAGRRTEGQLANHSWRNYRHWRPILF